MEILNNMNFNSKTREGLVLVDFFAVWCGPCQLMENVIKEFLKTKTAEIVKIYKVDIDKSEDLASKHLVMSVPTFILFKNGQEITREVGSLNVSSMEHLVNKYK